MFLEDEETHKVSKKKAASKKKMSAETVESGESWYHTDLPSSGLLGYPQVVEYRDMVMGDEKTLSMASNENYFLTLNKTLKSILGNPDWYEDMALGDRDYLLVWIWANNYGAAKELAYTCSECGHENTVTVDLTRLDVSEIDPAINDYVPFAIDLRCGTTIHLNMRRVADELELEQYMKGNDDTGEIIEAFFMTSMEIEDMEGATLKEKVKWGEKNIRVREMAMVRMFYEHIKFGVEEQFTHKCESCGEESPHTIPFRIEDILEPAVSDDFGKLLSANKGTQDQSD